MMEETKIYYYINDEEKPVLILCRCRPDQMTLGHFKKALKRPVSQFLFKYMDEDIGEIRQEITEDDAKLPHTNGKVMAWLTIPDQDTESRIDPTFENKTHKANKEKRPSKHSCRSKKQDQSNNVPKKTDKNRETESTESEATGDSSHDVDPKAESKTESKDINIVLLGETGVGKSTWINGFVNYLTYDTLEEAERGEPVSLIPAKFTKIDSNFNVQTISYNVDGDSNEFNENVGESVTQMAKSYLFNIDNVMIRIIDTPGIGDTRGIDQDRKNMLNILDHLAKYTHLNGIIVLLKPNNARLTVMFEFCIKELLTHLHKDACKNIIICFTNARGTNYKPGETMALLKELLSRNKIIEIKLNKDTVYCMDNESVRYLMAMRSTGFDEDDKEDSAASWIKAVEESKRMITYISSLEPHAIQNTISINEIRRAIIEQTRIVAHIAKAIQMDMDKIKEKDAEKIDVNKNKEDLLRQLQIPSTRLKSVRLYPPRTVCTASKCIEYVQVDGGASHIRYKTICDSQCTEINTVENVIGSEGIKKCKSMARGWIMLWTFTCKQCGCDSSTHMHITYEVAQETVMTINPDINNKINEKDGVIKAIEEHKKQLKDKLNQYCHEQKRLAEISAHFACFLKHNAIIPTNDALMDYMDHFAKKNAVKENDIDANRQEGLIEWKNLYENQIILIENRVKKDPDVINLENINKLLKELKELPNVGEKLKDAMAGVKEANEASTKVTEKVTKVTTTKSESNFTGLIKNVLSFFKK